MWQTPMTYQHPSGKGWDLEEEESHRRHATIVTYSPQETTGPSPGEYRVIIWTSNLVGEWVRGDIAECRAWPDAVAVAAGRGLSIWYIGQEWWTANYLVNHEWGSHGHGHRAWGRLAADPGSDYAVTARTGKGQVSGNEAHGALFSWQQDLDEQLSKMQRPCQGPLRGKAWGTQIGLMEATPRRQPSTSSNSGMHMKGIWWHPTQTKQNRCPSWKKPELQKGWSSAPPGARTATAGIGSGISVCVVYHINTPEGCIIQEPWRQIPQQLHEAIKLKLGKILEKAIIHESRSQWHSPQWLCQKRTELYASAWISAN